MQIRKLGMRGTRTFWLRMSFLCRREEVPSVELERTDGREYKGNWKTLSLFTRDNTFTWNPPR